MTKEGTVDGYIYARMSGIEIVTNALGVSIPFCLPPSTHSAPTFKHEPHDGTAPSHLILRL